MQLLVNIDVADLAIATDFYCRALGLTVGRRFGATAVELVGAPSLIYLLAKPAGGAATPAGTVRDYARHWTPVHLDFVVDDLEAAVERARAAGATVEQEITHHAWGDLALFADPFGHGFCLLAFRGRGYDELL